MQTAIFDGHGFDCLLEVPCAEVINNCQTEVAGMYPIEITL